MPIEYPAGFDSARDRKRPICGILAVALGADVSFDVAFQACKRNMPKHRQRMRGSTYKEQRDQCLKDFGVKFEVILTNRSVMEFCQYHENDGFTYLIEIRKHVMTFRNGHLIDQAINIPWRQYHHPRIGVVRAIKILGKGW
jgi:hypothetical protein